MATNRKQWGPLVVWSRKFFAWVLRPAWMAAVVREYDNFVLPQDPVSRVKQAVQIANRLAQLNVRQKTGGPFGAIVYDIATGRIVGWGVNRVTLFGCIFHGEMCAVLDACARYGTFSVGAAGLNPHGMATSAKPCGMCETATIWAGPVECAYGATGEDVERIVGFDEGNASSEEALVTSFGARGIDVYCRVLRPECTETLRAYAESGGFVYNGRKRETAEA